MRLPRSGGARQLRENAAVANGILVARHRIWVEPRRRLPTGGRVQTWTRPRSSPAVRSSPVRGGRGILTDGLDPPFHASMRVEWRACSKHGSAGQPGTCGVPGEWSNSPAAGGSAGRNGQTHRPAADHTPNRAKKGSCGEWSNSPAAAGSRLGAVLSWVPAANGQISRPLRRPCLVQWSEVSW